MNSTDSRNRKIIDAVIRKEQVVCPGAVALIGVYGSFMTGDVHPLSDLNLLILINDERGWQLGMDAVYVLSRMCTQFDYNISADFYSAIMSVFDHCGA
jgi:predicted nucleotidyltransferase